VNVIHLLASIFLAILIRGENGRLQEAVDTIYTWLGYLILPLMLVMLVLGTIWLVAAES
jgi:hypothetical protein